MKPNGHGSFRVSTSGELHILAASAPNAAGPLLLCIRPEALAVDGNDAAPATSEAVIEARVDDVVFTAGNVRYRVTTADGVRLVVRRPLQRHGRQIEPGASVRLHYSPADVLIIARE